MIKNEKLIKLCYFFNFLKVGCNYGKFEEYYNIFMMENNFKNTILRNNQNIYYCNGKMPFNGKFNVVPDAIVDVITNDSKIDENLLFDGFLRYNKVRKFFSN